MKDALRYLPEIVSHLGGGPLLLATDFDGTLCPIVDSPSDVRVPLAIVELLSDLRSSRRTSIAIISGRSVDDLASHAPGPAILAGSNGLEVRGPELEFRHPLAVERRPELEKARDRVAEAISRWPEAWIEDKGLTVSVHYRSVRPRYQSAVACAVRRALSSCGVAIGVRSGKKVLEIHPRCGWSKGDALSWIRSRIGAETTPCVCIGDDRMDEAMFAANPEGVNIRIGPDDRTLAGYCVRDPLGLVGVLACIARAMRAETAPDHSPGALLQPIAAGSLG